MAHNRSMIQTQISRSKHQATICTFWNVCILSNFWILSSLLIILYMVLMIGIISRILVRLIQHKTVITYIISYSNLPQKLGGSNLYIISIVLLAYNYLTCSKKVGHPNNRYEASRILNCHSPSHVPIGKGRMSYQNSRRNGFCSPFFTLDYGWSCKPYWWSRNVVIQSFGLRTSMGRHRVIWQK